MAVPRVKLFGGEKAEAGNGRARNDEKASGIGSSVGFWMERRASNTVCDSRSHA
jgi:hypothetical protein